MIEGRSRIWKILGLLCGGLVLCFLSMTTMGLIPGRWILVSALAAGIGAGIAFGVAVTPSFRLAGLLAIFGFAYVAIGSGVPRCEPCLSNLPCRPCVLWGNVICWTIGLGTVCSAILTAARTVAAFGNPRNV
jgi:hypothetical protein